MKVIKSIMVLFAAVASMSANAQQTPEFAMIHGSACQATSLGQAINFGASWSQNGLTNPNALGSGRSFFIVCPVVNTDDLSALTSPSDIRISIVYAGHDGTNDVSCFARRYESGDVIAQVNATDSPAAGFIGERELEFTNITDDATQNYNGIQDSHVVVCAMPPQATLQSLAYDFD